ncbi:unnamed protein product [Acanthoscelides obtectus]|uniref:DDE Tnp4 domain-containing protein n=1 Tax=Acanthoscelides obtectus TaxID=200917 RepID=A0A9P0KMS7_ACAOB|nr:unnamed protein product [Acanthoscelides obtectus]CAK1641655.1 hypothetical protein AOBTE_LOCUS12534 [Acanthoscelides obtectus]
MEIEECIAVWYLLNNKKKKLKRRRSLWVHPMLGLRESKGTYLATGCSLTELHYNYRVGISTASEIIQETCKLIWIFMKEQCIPKPTREKWLEIADGFLKNANYPHCLGAIDGKHIRVNNYVIDQLCNPPRSDLSTLFVVLTYILSTMTILVRGSSLSLMRPLLKRLRGIWNLYRPTTSTASRLCSMRWTLDPHEYLVQARLQMVFHFPEELVYYHLELNFPHL